MGVSNPHDSAVPYCEYENDTKTMKTMVETTSLIYNLPPKARILGSSVHTCTANKGAISMFFLTTAPSSSLSPPRSPPSLQPSSPIDNGSARHLLTSSPAPTKYLSRASRWGTAYVRSGEVGDWDRYGELAEVFAKECDRVWQDWKGRVIENGGAKNIGNGHAKGQGVKDKPVVN
jgi:hypothetical protein